MAQMLGEREREVKILLLEDDVMIASGVKYMHLLLSSMKRMGLSYRKVQFVCIASKIKEGEKTYI